MPNPLHSNAGREELNARFGKNPDINLARQTLINDIDVLEGEFRTKMDALDAIERDLEKASLFEERSKIMGRIGKVINGKKLAA